MSRLTAVQVSGCRTGWKVAQVTEVGSLEDEQVWGEVSWKLVSLELAEVEIHELSAWGDRIKVAQNKGLSWRHTSGRKHRV